MGLPIWGEPIAEKPRNALKTDLTASSRSPIRRSTSSQHLRPARRIREYLSTRPAAPHWHRSPPRIPEEPSIHSTSRSSPFAPHRLRALDDTGSTTAPIEPSIRPSHPPPVPDTPWSSSDRFLESDIRSDAGYRRRAMRWDNPPESWYPPTAGGQHHFHPTPPPPRPPRGHESGRTSRFHRSPPEPWLEDGPLDVPRVRVDSPRPISRDGSNPRSLRASALPTPPADMAETGFPPLQRMDQEPLQRMDDQIHRLNTRISHEQRRLDVLHRRHREYLRGFEMINGLGDRERSLSPPEDDHWETMLSTITPDPIAPSAGSSFASAAASASFSNATSSREANSFSDSATNSIGSHSVHTSITVPDEEGDDLEDCPDDNPDTYPSFSLEWDDDFDDSGDSHSDTSARTAIDYRRNHIASAPTPPLRQVTGSHLPNPYRRPSSTQPTHLRSPSPGGSRRSPIPRVSHPLSHSQSASATLDLSSEPRHSSAHTSSPRPSNTARDSLQTAIERRGGTNVQHQAGPTERTGVASHRSREMGELESSVAEVERRGQEMRGLMDGLGQRMQELDRMRSVIERLARRDDIPEEWWANVGLGGVGRRGRL